MDKQTYCAILIDGWRAYSDINDIDLIEKRKQKEKDFCCTKCQDKRKCEYYIERNNERSTDWKRNNYELNLNVCTVYNGSEKGKERYKRYNLSEKGKERCRKHERTEKRKEQRRLYNLLPAVKKKRKEREYTLQRKLYKKLYYERKKQERLLKDKGN